MKLPRNLSGDSLISGLKRLGYEATRQTGSHVRLSHLADPVHHVTVPHHSPLRVGTLNAVLKSIAGNLGLTVDEVLAKIIE